MIHDPRAVPAWTTGIVVRPMSSKLSNPEPPMANSVHSDTSPMPPAVDNLPCLAYSSQTTVGRTVVEFHAGSIATSMIASASSIVTASGFSIRTCTPRLATVGHFPVITCRDADMRDVQPLAVQHLLQV